MECKKCFQVLKTTIQVKVCVMHNVSVFTRFFFVLLSSKSPDELLLTLCPYNSASIVLHLFDFKGIFATIGFLQQRKLYHTFDDCAGPSVHSQLR